ncbi:MAG: hypothetical protein HFG05_12945 [Oscillibacter sp.]|nr:hypothetical protein [Oscillibacter sp.]
MKIDWTLVLSIIGASAWLPIIATPIINTLRKIQVALIDCEVLTSGIAISYDKKEKHGTILLLALNLYVESVDFFPTDISAKVKLLSGAVSNAVLLDGSTVVSNNGNGTKSKFKIPLEWEWNISRTIHHNSDNVKVVAFLVENIAFQQAQDIGTIKIILRSGKLSKKTIEINNSQFPHFNSSGMLFKYSEVLR